jgi:hypothetical protein
MTPSDPISTRCRIALQGICNMRIGPSSWWFGGVIDWSCTTTLYGSVLLQCLRALMNCSQRLPGREWVVGHKHLAFVVPLKGARTKLSLYSFTDMSFCIICPPASLHAGVKVLLPFQRRTGTNVFIFKTRCRSRAMDWIWRLWCVDPLKPGSRLISRC